MLNGISGSYREILEAGGFEVAYPPQGASLKDPDTLAGHLDGIDAVIASVEPYTDDVLRRSNLRVVARNGVGYDSVDVEAATRLGIPVAITPGVNSDGVAEHALALMLAVAHGYPWRDTEARSGTWIRRPLPRLAGKTIGLVGLGAIGKAVVPKALGLGMKVVAHDPVGDVDYAAVAGVELCPLDELYSRADVVSLHLPCTPETVDLIDRDALGKMKEGAILVNTARGGLVDEDALIDALQSGHLAGAGLDVCKTEPLPPDNPLAQNDKVLLCPHMAGIDCQSLEGMSSMAARSIVELYRGRWPEGRIVNGQLRDGWQW